MITSAALEKVNGIRHGFFTRRGGKSAGLFASLNCGYGSGDDQGAVRANRERAMSRIGLRGEDLVTAYQIHSATVTVVAETWRPEEAPKADAMVSRMPGVALGILTADCAPVLLIDPAAGIIGAAHAGWRGAKSGVLEATVGAMVALGGRPERMTAAIGPCIQQDSYEVSDSFRESFLSDNPSNEDFFAPSDRPRHYQFDLAGYAAEVLADLSIGHIDLLMFDTYADETLFFSYRRSTHHGEKRYGRLLSAIVLDPGRM